MDETQKAVVWACGITGLAANRAVIRLHALLAAQGTIDGGAVESLRHLHLRDFESAADEAPNEDARKALEIARSDLEQMWKSASQVPLRSNPPTE